MKKLSIIMPFLNEAFEPIKTILSINNTTNPDEIEIIAICDAPHYEYEEKIKQFSNVRFFKNNHGIGPHASHSAGIHLAKSDSVLLIDAHMRFANDDWVNKISTVVKEHPKTLWCARCLVLNHAMDVDPLKDVTLMTDWYCTGARLHYLNESKPLNNKWIAGSSYKEEFDGFVPCILGANYIGNTNWLKHIRSYEGLLNWGFSEQYLSIKNWLLGGDCRGLDSVSIGHIFRSRPPYTLLSKYNLYNMMFTGYTLFSDEHDIFENYMKLLRRDPAFNESMSMIESRWDVVSIYKNYFLANKTQTFASFLDRFNIPYKDTVYGTQ